jgi:RimJ/RimL family protein N-acetyltransferase
MGSTTRAVTPEVIRGTLVTLEPATVAQAEALVDGRQPPGLVLAAGFPHADTLDGLGMALTQSLPPGWLVVAEGRVVGDCGVHGPISDTGAVEIGYGLAAPERGRGYGTEVVALLGDWLLDQPLVRVVLAEVEPGNVASRRVLEKAGFVYEADLPGGVSYRLSR